MSEIKIGDYYEVRTPDGTVFGEVTGVRAFRVTLLQVNKDGTKHETPVGGGTALGLIYATKDNLGQKLHLSTKCGELE